MTARDGWLWHSSVVHTGLGGKQGGARMATDHQSFLNFVGRKKTRPTAHTNDGDAAEMCFSGYGRTSNSMSNLSRVTLASMKATAESIQKNQANEAGGSGDESQGIAGCGTPWWSILDWVGSRAGPEWPRITSHF